jgi:hypothetical protein
MKSSKVILAVLVLAVTLPYQAEAVDTVTASPTKGPAATESTVPSVDQVATPVPSASPKKRTAPLKDKKKSPHPSPT